MNIQPRTGKSLSTIFLGVILLVHLFSGISSPGAALAQSEVLPEAPGADPSVYLPLLQSSGGVPASYPINSGSVRGYTTTPGELALIKQKAGQGSEPYETAYDKVMQFAKKDWDYQLESTVTCPNSDSPDWLDNTEGAPILFAKALAFHMERDSRYAEEVKTILEQIMSQVKDIDSEQGCRLRFAWGTPELVASADLIEDYWKDMACTGPLSTAHGDARTGSGNCKDLFQNWLVKNPYYMVSLSATGSQSNWGAAATNATAYVADYLWDRPEVKLVHRNPEQENGGKDYVFTPAEAYRFANQLMLDRMNGFRVEYHSGDSCDYLGGSQQDSRWAPVKSQITPNGVIPEDSRREQSCNSPAYDGAYHNYPQLHIGHNIQQCELMLRRGDRACFDNVDMRDLPNYSFVDPKGVTRSTHLYPGRGSVERVIQAVILDSGTEWRHDAALAVAYRYYFNFHRLPGVERWLPEINKMGDCGQDVCFGSLTHGFAPDERPGLPPVTRPPQ